MFTSFADCKIMTAYVGIDIGGSHLGLSIFDDENILLASHSEPLSPADSPEQLVERVVQIILALITNLPLKRNLVAVGMGCPGQCRDGVLVAAANFPAWGMNVPLANMLSKRLKNIPVTLVNDADAAIAAEVWGTVDYKHVKHAAMISAMEKFS